MSSPHEDLHALRFAIAGSIVRKEIAVLRKLWGRPNCDEASREFYEKHAAYVQSRLLCAPECAAYWCRIQLSDVLASDDLDLMLEVWESSAAAWLADLAATSASELEVFLKRK